VGLVGIVGLMFGSSDLNIVHTSRHFQPCADNFDDRFLFVGPSLGSRTETAGFQWDGVSQADVIYISLGTPFNADPTFYRNCFEAFGGENVRVVMSIGTTIAERWQAGGTARGGCLPCQTRSDGRRSSTVGPSRAG
jgi:UDP:flavonoid glycosyltransferase YjiC (YdhE family)